MTPLIIAGATGYGVWPDNTLGGRACSACEAPVDGIEIDVQITSDGHVVAHHDYRLSRRQTRLDGAWITGDRADPERHDPGAAAPLRCGPGAAGCRPQPRYPHRPSTGRRADPDPCRAVRGPEGGAEARRLILHRDQDRPACGRDDAPDPELVVEAVIDELDAQDYVAHTKIIAFDWQVLRLTRRPQRRHRHRPPDDPDAQTGGPADGGGRHSPWADGCDPRHHGGSDLAAIKAHGGMEWSPYYTDVTPERVDEARGLGLKVGPWGLSSAEDIGRMQSLGVWSCTVAGPAWGR